MPGTLIERPKMSRCMYQALKRHIMREREKKKQEQQQDEEMERLKKERELRKKKEEMDSLTTLEENKEQIAELERKLEGLRNQKHELFSQLKKVLHQEDNSKKKAQMREQSELMTLQQQGYPAGMAVPGHAAMFMQGTMLRPSSKYLNHIQAPGVQHGGKFGPQRHPEATMLRPSSKYLNHLQVPPGAQATMLRPSSKYLNHLQVPPGAQGGLKRARSPSPPPQAPVYATYNSSSNAKYPATTYSSSTAKPDAYAQQKPPTSYPAQSTHVTYASQSGHTYQQPPPQGTYPTSQSAAGNKYPSNQSAFTSYPNHYAHQQKQITDHYPPGYGVQRLPQPQQGYINSPHTGSSLPLQQQLEHANQKAGFSEEKFKLQQHSQQLPRGLAPQQMMALPQHGGPPVSAAAPPKGSIMTGYPVRTQAAPQSTHSSPPGAPRHTYSGPQPGRYY